MDIQIAHFPTMRRTTDNLTYCSYFPVFLGIAKENKSHQKKCMTCHQHTKNQTKSSESFWTLRSSSSNTFSFHDHQEISTQFVLKSQLTQSLSLSKWVKEDFKAPQCPLVGGQAIQHCLHSDHGFLFEKDIRPSR